MLSELTAVCGVSCIKCPAYQATLSGNPAELERIAAEWSRAQKSSSQLMI
jgi:hypothetical protein